MSIHRSLVSGSNSRKHRSVLKRFERIEHLQKAGKWKEGDVLFGLPKVKVLRVKVKKEKAEESPETAAAGAPAAAAAPAATPKAPPKKEGK